MKLDEEKRVKFAEDDQLEEFQESNIQMPKIDSNWDVQDPRHRGRDAFTEAWINQDYNAMEDAIKTYQIKFKPNKALEDFAYETIDHHGLFIANYLLKNSLIESSEIQEYLNHKQREGYELFSTAYSAQDFNQMTDIILRYQLNFPQDLTSELSYLALKNQHLELFDHLLAEKTPEERENTMQYQDKKDRKTLRNVLNDITQRKLAQQDFKTLANLVTKYGTYGFSNRQIETMAYNAIDHGHPELSEYLIQNGKISANFRPTPELPPLQQKLLNQHTKMINLALESQDYPVLQHLFLQDKVKIKPHSLSKIAYNATMSGYINLAQYLIDKGGASPDYVPKGKTTSLQEKLAYKLAKIHAKRITDIKYDTDTGKPIKIKQGIQR